MTCMKRRIQTNRLAYSPLEGFANLPAILDREVHKEITLCNHRHACALAKLSLDIQYIASINILLLVLLFLTLETQAALVLVLLVANNLRLVESSGEWIQRQYLLSSRKFWQLCASSGYSNKRFCLCFVWRRRLTLFI